MNTKKGGGGLRHMMYSKIYYYLWQDCGLLWVLQYPLQIKIAAMIYKLMLTIPQLYWGDPAVS